MSNIKYILGSFGDPDEMMQGIDKLQENNIKINDVYTPMPIHGIEAKLGVKRSRLDKAAFFFGARFSPAKKELLSGRQTWPNTGRDLGKRGNALLLKRKFLKSILVITKLRRNMLQTITQDYIFGF